MTSPRRTPAPSQPVSGPACPRSSSRRLLSALPVLGLGVLTTMVWAQTTPAPTVTLESKEEEEVVELSPFVVTSNQELGYRATNTLAGTRLNTELKDIGAAVSVYTQEFLEDINATKLEDILTYTASTESAGTRGNYSGVVGENSAEVRDDPSGVNRVRALAQATRTRDFFATDIPVDTYSFESLTVNRGPNAILAGIGNAGGVIDAAMRKATFKDNYRLVSRFGSYGSHREELHINKVLIPNQLALRVDLLNDESFFRQNPTYAEDRRVYAALNYRAFNPKPGSIFGRGTIRANFEYGKIEGVPPDPLTPTFTVGNWFNTINPRWRYDGARQLVQNANGATVTGNAATTGIQQGFPLFSQWALIYANPTSGEAGVGIPTSSLANIQGFQGAIPGAALGGPGGALRGTGDANRLRSGFYRTKLSDPQIFNFYDQLLSGVFDFRQQDFSAGDIRYEQLLLDGKAGFELAYNNQSFTRKRDFPIPGSGDDEGIFVDVNAVLSVRSTEFPLGIPNPNFGRPFISTPDVFREAVNRTDRESYQLTAFFKHDFTRSENDWVRHLGRHTLSGLFFNTEIDRTSRNYNSTWDPAGQYSPFVNNNGVVPGTFGAQVNGWFYVGPSLLSATGLQDVRIQPISAERPQYGQSYNVRIWDTVTRQFVTASATPARILNRVVDQREEIASNALALQSHWLKNHLVTTFGFRYDSSDAFTSVTPVRLANGNLDDSAIAFLPAVSQSKRSLTKSVVGVMPFKLPFDTEVRAFWNESGNFNPVGQRRNVWNEELGSPTAETTEYGLMLSAFNDKLFLRVNRYNTNILSDSIAVHNPYAYVNTVINNMVQANTAGLNPANFGYIHPSFTTFAQVALAVYETIPTRLKNNIGPDKNFNPRFTGSGNTLQWVPETITGLSSISDTESMGTEFEAIINPVKGWRVSLSVAKNEAVKANVAVEELAFIDAWKANLDTMYNGALLNGRRNPANQPNETGTFWAQYQAEHVSRVRTAAALSGVASPEIRKWRANLVTRYNFSRGFMKGVNIGGAVRWQDKIGIGYPFTTNTTGQQVADISNPYYGPSDISFDVNAGYTRKLKFRGTPITWTLGINVRNLNAKEELIPIAANADGSWGTFRIAPDRTWVVTNSFAF